MKKVRVQRPRIRREQDLASIRALPRDERVLRAATLVELEAKGHPFKESTEAFLVRHGYPADEVKVAAQLAGVANV